jgi:hypothetical protein
VFSTEFEIYNFQKQEAYEMILYNLSDNRILKGTSKVTLSPILANEFSFPLTNIFSKIIS